MSDNSINIKGLNFKNLPDDFKIEIDPSKISYQTGKALEKIEGVDISDGIDKTEAELIIMEINTDEDADEISMEEIRKFCSDNKITDKSGEVKTDKIESLVSAIVDNAREILDPQEETGNTEEEADTENAEETGKTGETPAAQNNTQNTEDNLETIKVNVQPWKSAPEDGNKYANDCLDHIMRNYYPDIEPYSQEWRDKELEIMNANPDIYGTVDENGNVTGARKAVGGTGRHNAVLYDSDEITLPGIKTEKPVTASEESNESAPVAGSEETEEGTDVSETEEGTNVGNTEEGTNVGDTEDENDGTEGLSGDEDGADNNLPENSTQEDTGKVTDDNGYSTETITDENGNIVGKKQYDDENNIMWESTISAGENNTTIETRAWADSGIVQEIVYDENGKEISINTTYADETTSTTNFTYDEDGNKTAEVIYYDKDKNQTASAKLTFDDSGSYVEEKEYADGIKETSIYDQYQTIMEKTVTKTDNTKTTTSYENGKPSSTISYDAESNEVSTTVYEYTEDGYNETVTYNNPENNGNIVTKTNVYDVNGKIIETTGSYLDGSTYHTEYVYEEDGSYTAKYTYEQKETNPTYYKEREIKYDSEGNEVSETYTLLGDETTGEIIGTKTFEGDKETDTQLEQKTGKVTTKVTEGDTVTVSVSQNNTNTTTVSKNDIKTKETVTEYAPESTNELSKTETEFYEDGETPKVIEVKTPNGSVKAEFNQDGTIKSVEGNPRLLPEEYAKTSVELQTSAENLGLTELSAIDKAILESEGKITQGDYTIQKLDDGSLITVKNIKVEENGIIKDVQMIVKQEWPDTGNVELYEEYNGERRLKQELKDGNTITHNYTYDYQELIFDKNTRTFKTGDTALRRETIETKDADGNIISVVEKAYGECADGVTREYIIAEDIYENGQFVRREETAKIEMYTQALKDGSLGDTGRYEVMMSMLNDENMTCGILADILAKFTIGEKIDSFMDMLPNNDDKEQKFFDKLAQIIEKSSPDEVGSFLDKWKSHSDNNSLMNSIQERQSHGTETATLKTIARALNGKINDMNIDYSSDSILATAQKNEIRKNAYDITKIYNLATSGEIDDKTALSLLMYISDGDLQNIINVLRGGGDGWWNSINSGFSDGTQEEYVKFIEDLIISVTTNK